MSPEPVFDLADVAAAVSIDVPQAHRMPIAIVGAGAIVQAAHLPAYESGGLSVHGLFDVDRDRAEDVATRYSVPVVYPDLDALMSDPAVGVVDVAIPAAHQPAVVDAALRSGHHVLTQKPFAPDLRTAVELVELADLNSRVLAVNQQLRFDEGIAAAHEMVRRGWIGAVSALSITVDIWTEWSDWPWLLSTPRLEIMNHSIHYHDVVRWFLGEPETVFCVGGRRPGQAAAGETRTISTYRYPDDVIAVVHANHMNDHGDPRAEFRIDGSEGALRGTLGLLYDYPRGRPDTLEVTSKPLGTDGWQPYPVSTRWLPDAFLGPMASLLASAAGGSAPRTSARDNLGTLRLVQALHDSMDTGRAVEVAGAPDPRGGSR